MEGPDEPPLSSSEHSQRRSQLSASSDSLPPEPVLRRKFEPPPSDAPLNDKREIEMPPGSKREARKKDKRVLSNSPCLSVPEFDSKVSRPKKEKRNKKSKAKTSKGNKSISEESLFDDFLLLHPESGRVVWADGQGGVAAVHLDENHLVSIPFNFD